MLRAVDQALAVLYMHAHARGSASVVAVHWLVVYCLLSYSLPTVFRAWALLELCN